MLWMRTALPGRRRPEGPVKMLYGVVALLLVVAPLGGMAVWKRVFGFYPGPSLPMLGLMVASCARSMFGTTLLRREDWRAIWLFGLFVGSMLYLRQLFSALPDLYYWGWEQGLSALVLGSVAILFIAMGNRLGVLLFAGLLASGLKIYESLNCWDYIIDPLYWLAGVVWACRHLCSRIAGAVRRGRSEGMCEQSGGTAAGDVSTEHQRAA